jgi:hypothetical protein
MPIRTFDFACDRCNKEYWDVVVKLPTGETKAIAPDEEDIGECADGTKCGPFRVLLPKPQAYKHSSWSTWSYSK